MASMSSLRSVLDELQADDLRFHSDEELEDGLLELERANAVLYAERLRRLRAIEQRRTYLRDGYLSASVWLAQRVRTSYSEAKLHVRTARALEEMPATERALAEGEISPSGVRVLLEARETNPEESARGGRHGRSSSDALRPRASSGRGALATGGGPSPAGGARGAPPRASAPVHLADRERHGSFGCRLRS